MDNALFVALCVSRESANQCAHWQRHDGFREVATSADGQGHLFPVLTDARLLSAMLDERVGVMYPGKWKEVERGVPALALDDAPSGDGSDAIHARASDDMRRMTKISGILKVSNILGDSFARPLGRTHFRQNAPKNKNQSKCCNFMELH